MKGNGVEKSIQSFNYICKVLAPKLNEQYRGYILLFLYAF